MSPRVPIFSTVAIIVLALAVAGAAAFSGWRTDKGPEGPKISLAGSRLGFTQTEANQALIKLPNAKPGQVARGLTRITLTGVRANVALTATNLRDVAGINGGRLIASKRLWIDVRCAGALCPPKSAGYHGPLSDMGTRSLGSWAPGTIRTYAIQVWLRRGGIPPSDRTGDNAFQASRATFGLVWTATT